MSENAVDLERVAPPAVAGDGRPPTPARRALLSPVLDLLRPRRAAICLVSAPWALAAGLLLAGLLSYACVLVALLLWNDTLTGVWVLTSAYLAATNPATLPANGAVDEWRLQQYSPAKVWADWHAGALGGWFGVPEIVLSLVLLLGIVALLAAAWLNLPLIHRTGSITRSYGRAVRVTAGAIWPCAALTLTTGSIIVARTHAELGAGGTFSYGPPLLQMGSVVVSLCLLAVWLRRAIDAAAALETRPDLPPVCEGCGYDLTHQPADGRCSECGGELASSLDENRSRPGSGWDSRKSVRTWLGATCAVLRRPGAFYRQLKLRTPAGAGAGFAAGHYLLIGCAATAWFAGIAVVADPWLGGGPMLRWEDLSIGCMVTAIGVLACGLGHRVLGALVATWWLWRGGLPDFRWVEKVIRYETAYLWVLCCYWGFFSTLMRVNSSWLSATLGVRGSGMPPEILAFFAGTTVLVGVWLWRYELAYRAIRWSNY
jgi:hypothetical protein